MPDAGSVIKAGDVRRIDVGYFIRPPEETGTGAPRVEPVLAYAVRVEPGWLLFDTGVGAGAPEIETHYRPRRRNLREAARASGVDLDDVHIVANCHLHFDHCGGNPLFTGRPIVTQKVELAAARTVESYTLPYLIDFADVRYDVIDGEAEIFPGVWVIPTAGHTAGHQSLVVKRLDGTVILAGQAHDSATQYTGDHLARQARNDGATPPLPTASPWLARLEEFDPRRVVFAHDLAVWEPGKNQDG